MTGDPYAVLGVPRTATPAQITSAFHRLVRRHHPDAHPAAGDEDLLREVISAYAVLKDPARRARHDDALSRPAAPLASPAVSPGAVPRQPMIRVGPVRYHGLPEHR